MVESAERAALTVLHYAAPPAEIVLFLCVATIVFCGRYQPKKRKSSERPYHHAFLGLLAGLVLTYAAQVAFLIFAAVKSRTLWPSQDVVSSAALSVLLWGSLFTVYADTTISLHSHVCTWILAVALESTIGILTGLAHAKAGSTPLEQAIIIFCAVRLVIYAGLISFGAKVLFKSSKHGQQADTEQTQPLLRSDDDNGTATTYGATPKDASQVNSASTSSNADEDSDEDDWDVFGRNKDIRKRQTKRLEEEGGWWGYLKGFTIFLPYIIPFKDRRIQAYLAILLVCLLAGRVLRVLQPRQFGIIVDAMTQDAGTGKLPLKELLVWFLLKFVSSSAGMSMLESFLQDRVDQFAERQIYNVAFKHVMELSLDFHSDKQTGEVIQGVSQADSLAGLLQTLLFELAPVGLDLVVTVTYITHLFDFYIAIIVFTVGLIYVWTTYKMTRFQAPRRRAWLKSLRDASMVMSESIYNWPTVAYFNHHKKEVSKFSSAVTARIHNYRSWYNAIYLTRFIDEITVEAGFLAACLLAAHRVADGAAPVGNFVVLVTMWSNLTSPLKSMAHSFKYISSQIIDAERLLELLQTKPSVTTKPDAKPLNVVEGAVEFENVSFAYDPRKQALSDINFRAEGGQTVALVGETGGGKSTILKLLFRFYDVNSGSIRIDGQDLRDVTLDSVREAFGVVPQDPALFNMTIMENLLYAREDATEEEVYDACKAAAIHDKIMSFPDQYHSKVGERGVKLSGGELQRVAIARVILKKPSLVLLDEATSAVDSATENTIQKSFHKLATDRTTFVIAHRLSTIKNADLILVIEGGRIIESGTHTGLLGQGGKYDKLWSHQSAKKTAPEEKGDREMAGGSTKGQSDSLLIDISDEAYSAELAKQGATEPSGQVLDQADGAGSCEAASSSASSATARDTPLEARSPRHTSDEE